MEIDNNTLGGLIGAVITAVAGLFWKLHKMGSGTVGDPVEVSLPAGVTTRAEGAPVSNEMCGERCSKIGSRMDGFEARVSALETHRTADLMSVHEHLRVSEARTHERIDTVLAGVSELKGEMRQISLQISGRSS